MNLHVYECSQSVVRHDLSREMVTAWQVVNRPPLTKEARLTINTDANILTERILSSIYPARWAQVIFTPSEIFET